MLKNIFLNFCFITCLVLGVSGQTLDSLTVEKIMRDPKWMGTPPTDYLWSKDSRYLFFEWNPDNKAKSEVYKLDVNTKKYALSSIDERREEGLKNFIFNKDRSLALFVERGDVYLYTIKDGKTERLTTTVEQEQPIGFLNNNDIVYQRGSNVFLLQGEKRAVVQLTNFLSGANPRSGLAKHNRTSDHDLWLEEDQLALFDVLKEKKKEKEEAQADKEEQLMPKPIYYGDAGLSGLSISPDGKYVSYRLHYRNRGGKVTEVPEYVTESGYVSNMLIRTKVGATYGTSESFVYSVDRDTSMRLDVNQISGIKDLPDYLKDYPEQLKERSEKNENRDVNWGTVRWSGNGKDGVVTVKSLDNKDFWILKVDPSTSNVTLIDRQRDEAWVAGPGIGRDVTWIDDDQFYFQSEASGYSHLYTYNVSTESKKQLTQGNWEVQAVQLSADKKYFYITANKEHPGIKHFYTLPITGGEMKQLTELKGGNEVLLSPDEKWLAVNHSYMDKPWELYLQENKKGSKALQITKSTTAEFDSYAWRKPDMISFKNRHGNEVYARVYTPKEQHPNRPAVVFVHGAGYLQNVHFWWSQYFREYMFNNMLADLGYTVIDIDYTASSGYGRDHRTGIYRHMGGVDLSDHVDGVQYLVDNYNVNPENVGIYGGSYGGFITLMALFNEPDVFRSGAALRSVTDWAHYNHGYTSNILNTPVDDPIAYKRSSPIYFADSLKGNLLMLHGMVDVNVQFQDIVRLTQRFIELGKDNWDLAVYPVEDHGFVHPSSWTDEYKRIFRLFEDTLKK
ncbi:prolyl oligopeptidase family serine peptidase [Sphingobacterium sp. UT-1RO-CII-1]|uniref:S9 family peptidase n=1 Tax=Sphingobacterium sp. UT-1RO-CII-1 TaxID=2995225 RepID=UPI00227CE42B|nr:prolyl oligopeptidase family serine peptidase [Sphingobacterium sp. UT-1RO-CII-1]MCY4779910.1 prolyl oligopeptidase family serine peptidase [Sphingobacterium sp. UT-1RO-CII-1]